MTFGLAGMAVVVAASLALYLASPQQLAVRRALPRRVLGRAGAAGLVAGLFLLLKWAGPATAVFIALTLVMLVWTGAPMLAAWLRRPKGDAG